MVTTDLDRSMKGSKRADQLYLGPTLGMTDAQQNILSVTTGGTTAVDLNITLVEVNFAGPVTIQLPSTRNINPNLGTLVRQEVTVVDIGGTAGTNNITILPFGSETIIGLASITISSNYGSFSLGPLATGGWTLTDQNPSSVGQTVFATRSDVQVTIIPVLTSGIQTLGYTSVGDDGGAIYKKVGAEPTHLGKVQSADGAWWEVEGTPINVKTYGARGNASNDDTAAIQSAIDTAGTTGSVYIPEGIFKTTSTITIANFDISIRGIDSSATEIRFSPTADDTCILISNGVSIIPRTHIYGIMINSTDNTFVKTAIEVIDADSITLRDVEIGGNGVIWTGPNPAVTPCIGLKCRGRDFYDIENFRSNADLPLSIEDNPNHTIDLDHANFTNMALVANQNPCIKVASGCNLSHITFDGQQSWNKGTYGLYWDDTTATQVSHNIAFYNVRPEQGTDPTAYSYYISRLAPAGYVFSISWINCNLDIQRQGIYLRQVRNATVVNASHTPIVPKESFNINNSVENFGIINCYWGVNSIANIGAGVNLMWATPNDEPGGTIPSTAFYSTGTTGFQPGPLMSWGPGDVNIVYSSNQLNFSGATNSYNFDNNIGISGTGINTAFVVTTTEASATTSPYVIIARDSPSPANNDFLGAISFRGRDSLNASQEYAFIHTQATDVTSGTEDGRVLLYTTVNGALALSATFQNANILAAGELQADGDTGGLAGTNAITGTSDLTANAAGVGTILFKGATNRNSTGFIKIYVGTTAYYVPVFAAITG